MLMLANPGQHRQRTLDAFRAQGIDPGRIEFEETRSRPAYLKLFDRIDVSLDTFPATGHTTTLDSLWMGVPVISLPGPTAISRGAMSILTTMGLSEFAAANEEQYVRIAQDLADDRDKLKSLRSTLRQRMRCSPLMDAPRFARNMEALYRRMWQKWCSR
jgi:predicted O-linked N-acetylglucosamine transferase (SPINDLY family)